MKEELALLFGGPDMTDDKPVTDLAKVREERERERKRKETEELRREAKERLRRSGVFEVKDE